VANSFRRLLAREADPGNLDHFTPICQKQGLAAVLKAHATSAEFVKRFGNDQVPFPPPAGGESLFWKVVKTAVKIGAQIIAKK
jgi:hypothetical protein